MLCQLGYEATDVGSRSIVGSYALVKEMSVNDIWNKSYMNCGNEMKMTQLHKLRSLRRSFLHFYFISAVHIWFISYIINTDFFYGNIWAHNWPAPNVSGFIAQLVEHRTGKSRGHGFKPRWSPEFFSGFFTQLQKLRSLRRSFLHFQNRLPWDIIPIL